MRPEKMKTSLALLVLLATLTYNGAAMADEPADFADALSQAAQGEKILVVDFFTDW